ncbi:MAG TPA: SIS domain-containing protein [Longimicrobiales bacterium]
MTADNSPIARHLEGLADVAQRVAREMSSQIDSVTDLVIATLTAGSKLMFCGNGGSAADAQHLATEYVVRFRRDRRALTALALTTDTSLLTAAANDLGFEQVFARQVTAHGRPGDLLFLHSTSGVSPNLLAAADAARAAGVKTVAMLGKGGGPLRERVDYAVVIPTDIGAHAQELHMAIGHAICDVAEARLSQ